VSKEFGFKPFETIQGFRIVTKNFEVGDELTATFKPRRHVITERYEKLIDEMFHHSRSTKQF
jgi:long-chain acyl-CoA synthetase